MGAAGDAGLCCRGGGARAGRCRRSPGRDDETAVEGQVESLGVADGSLYREGGAGWTLVGAAEYDDASGELAAEYELE